MYKLQFFYLVTSKRLVSPGKPLPHAIHLPPRQNNFEFPPRQIIIILDCIFPSILDRN